MLYYYSFVYRTNKQVSNYQVHDIQVMNFDILLRNVMIVYGNLLLGLRSRCSEECQTTT